MKVLLANPRGFCAGVNMAIESLERALDLFGTPLYVYHEIVHNRPVVERFRKRGVIFVDGIEEIPVGSNVLYSAHGVAPLIRKAAEERQLRAIDATCPLVTKVHLEAVRFAREGYTILLIGHEGHDEVLGTMGEAPASIHLVQNTSDVERLAFSTDAKLAYLTQTTLSLDETRDIVDRLKQRFPMIQGPQSQDICYATENRQMAVKAISTNVDLLLVVGSENSSNSKRLVEVGDNFGVRSHLVNDRGDVDPTWLDGVKNVGVTAGASAPEHLVQELIAFLRERGFEGLEEIELVDEDVRFSLPAELTISIQ